MTKEKFLIVGSGGRESAFAIKLYQEVELYAFISHKNPTIIDCVNKSDGSYIIGDVNNGLEVASFATNHNIDYAFVSADDPLANGVVDAMLAKNIKAVGGTKQATQIEWDKIYSIEMMQQVCPEFTPFYLVISAKNQLFSAIQEFQNKRMQVVVKPQGLTGGKGVKIMPDHLKDYDACIDYATELLDKDANTQVLLVEKCQGLEFTIMGITDGIHLVMSPATYDYPFRLENDQGAGTGGMGCFTSNENKLPFMTDNDWQDCKTIMQRIIDHMRNNGLLFNGVLNGGFFKTKQGIRFMEFNARFGDPEGLNILTVLASSFADLIKRLYHQTLSEDNIRFTKQASVTKYLVAKEYPKPSNYASVFTVDQDNITKMGVHIFFASVVEQEKGTYETLQKSRAVAFGAVAPSISQASDMVNNAIEHYVHTNLEYRKDIGSERNLAKLLHYDFN